MRQQMESRDEETLELKETYSSLQQEVDIKTKKLKKVENWTHIYSQPSQEKGQSSFLLTNVVTSS